jgi:hypothetical protein
MRGVLARGVGCSIVLAMSAAIGMGTAKAAVKYCDLSPENCYYAGDGMRYYMPPGSKLKRDFDAGKVTIPMRVEYHRKVRERELKGSQPNK